MTALTAPEPVVAVELSRAVEKLSTAVKLDSLTAAVEAVELSRNCRELSRIAVELSSRGSARLSLLHVIARSAYVPRVAQSRLQALGIKRGL